jgi:hypothetical protein
MGNEWQEYFSLTQGMANGFPETKHHYNWFACFMHPLINSSCTPVNIQSERS